MDMNKTGHTKTIAFVCSGFNSVYGGNFIASLVELEKELNGHGTKVLWVFNEKICQRAWYKQLVLDGHEFILVNFDVPAVQRIRVLNTIFRENDVSLIHIHFGDHLTPVLAAFFEKIVIVWHEHSDFSLGEKEKPSAKVILRSLLNRMIDLRINRIVVSEALKKRRYVLVENGIAAKHLPSLSKEETQEVRKQLGISDGTVLVLMFAWDPVVKGADIAVEMVKKARRSNTNIELAIVAGEHNNTSAYITEKCGDCEEFIRYLPPIEDVYKYHCVADVFLSASRSEGFSYSVCEALWLEKPCVVSDIPGCRWTWDFETVKHFDSCDAESGSIALQEAIHDLSEDRYMRSLKADSLRARGKYNAEDWSKNIVDAYMKFGWKHG